MRTFPVFILTFMLVSFVVPLSGCEQEVAKVPASAQRPQEGISTVTSPGAGSGIRGTIRAADETRDRVNKHQQDLIRQMEQPASE